MSDRPVIAVVGPTASGKSDLGIELALRYGGEIVNCDSVQVYQRIWVATAKVPFAERRGVPHHLLDFVPPEVNYTAGEWARAAISIVEGIESRGRLAILVGGTGFYLRALRQPLFAGPPTDEDLRGRLQNIRARRGAEYLHRILRRLDPESAARLAPRDWARVQRALEVRLATGQTIGAHRARHAPEPPALAARLHVFALNPPRETLYERIDRRTGQHFAGGLVDEVRELLAEGVPADSNALGAHGYRRVVEYLQGKRESVASALDQTRLDVRHYAKRQLTWFRRETGVEWVDGFGDEARIIERVARRVEALLRPN